MARTLCTGNYAAGYALAVAGDANRDARGCCGGAYPITPQTEIIEYLRAWDFKKGRIVPVESEHSAMGVCIGAALDILPVFIEQGAQRAQNRLHGSKPEERRGDRSDEESRGGASTEEPGGGGSAE